MTASATTAPTLRRPALSTAALAALGIVFGDLGTSPLYATMISSDQRKSDRQPTTLSAVAPTPRSPWKAS